MPKKELRLITIVVAFAIYFSEEIFFRDYFVSAHRKIYFFLLAAFITIFLHEGIHGLFAYIFKARPKFGFRYVFFYTKLSGLIKRNYYLYIVIGPFILLNFIFLFLFITYPILRSYLFLSFTLNTAGSVGDMWSFFTMLRYKKEYLIKDTMEGYEIYSE
jgi:hypothetical protein